MYILTKDSPNIVPVFYPETSGKDPELGRFGQLGKYLSITFFSVNKTTQVSKNLHPVDFTFSLCNYNL